MGLNVFGTEIPTNMDILEVFGKDMDELEVFGATVWQKQKYYYITFNSNGGTGSMSRQTMPVGVATALLANAFSKLGYLFNGWAKSASGAKEYSDKQSVKDIAAAGATATLYALWNAITWYIKFNANGGSGSMANQEFKYDTAENLNANAFSRSGYNFQGWATSASGSKVYNNKQSVKNLKSTHGAVLNLYAVWELASLEIYNATYYYPDNFYFALSSENVKNTDYVTTATIYSIKSGQGADPPHSGSGTQIILQLTEKAKEFKYAKVTLLVRAYANYGIAKVTLNDATIANVDSSDTGIVEKEVTITLSSTLTGEAKIAVVNNSSAESWYSYGAIAVKSVVLTNNA